MMKIYNLIVRNPHSDELGDCLNLRFKNKKDANAARIELSRQGYKRSSIEVINVNQTVENAVKLSRQLFMPKFD